MNREQYKHSKIRLVLLLAQFAIIAYTIIGDDIEARLLGMLVLPLWIGATITWLRR